ncbi:CS1-pili formation C-terminal domain-containing protein [Pseudomonas alabamensis]|uniref:CS1-pili formation C-terminal domain-containing protein n=1 Tax=Pseudomonas alabamensis TaxID=3064349 RepID=UPI003F57C661
MAMFFPLRIPRHASRGACLCIVLLAMAGPAPASVLSAIAEGQGLPKEFEAHFFDVPLAVRVDLDGRYLGDAMVVLSRDERVQLLEFTDTQESQEAPALRRRWQERLADGRSLGDCQTDCPDGLRAIHYSLVNSQLSLLTTRAELKDDVPRYHALPEARGVGILLRNQLNLVGGERNTTGRYAFQGQGSLGNWTTLAEAQVDRGSDQQVGTRHRLDQLYGERIIDDHFYRLGYFRPDAQGLTRQPRLYGSSPDTTLGLMFGSSDSLLIDNGRPSATPIYVTPNRPAIVEIYRNGVLINSQSVQPGLQTLDTRVLPVGIYEVEVRLVEDGQETSRTQEFIYKPSNWSNTDSRWRYNVYLGQQSTLLTNWDQEREGSLSAGVLTNYLLHPSAVLGLSAQRVDRTLQYGTSLDWDIHDRLKFYGNVYQTDGRGQGYDFQLIQSHALGSLVFSHSRSRVLSSRTVQDTLAEQQDVVQTSLALNHRVTERSTATLRLAHSDGAASGLGVDLGWAFYGKVLGSDANWRLSLFDRPGSLSTGNARNRGVNLSLSMSLGRPGQRVGFTLGSRTSRDGGRDQNASLNYQQDVDFGPVQALSGTATFDRYGTGLSGRAQLYNQYMYGDAYLQSSSYNNKLNGGLNLQSLVALGDGKLAMSGQFMPQEAGLIVDVESDQPDLVLRADDNQGGSTQLRPGRNVVPVAAYKAGHVQFDFAQSQDPGAVIQPTTLDYHLNRGGVAYQQVRVMRTVTVLGRLVDAQGQPLPGASVINHASRSVSEADGYFAVQMSRSSPTLEVRRNGQPLCSLQLDLDKLASDDDVLLADDLACARAPLAQVGQRPGGES